MGLISNDIKQLVNRILISNRIKHLNKLYYSKTYYDEICIMFDGLCFNWRNVYVRTINRGKIAYHSTIYNIKSYLIAELPPNY